MQPDRTILSIIALACSVGLTGPSNSAFGQLCPRLEFNPPVALNGNADVDLGSDADESPHLATDGQGNWIAVWQSNADFDPDGPGGPLGLMGSDFDILFSHASYDRTTGMWSAWTPPLPVDTGAAFDGARNDTNPRIATENGKPGNWVVVWESRDLTGGPMGNDFDILFSVSADVGTTWSAPAWLHDPVAHNNDDKEPQIVTDGKGKWVAIWSSRSDIGGIGTDSDVLFSWTGDIAAQNPWADPAALNSNADVDSGFDGDPQIATDGKGNWVAVWESKDPTITGDGLSDILYSRGTDIAQGGVAWIPAQALEGNAGSDSFSSDLDPHIATDGNAWMAVWDSNINLVDPASPPGADQNILFSLGILQPGPNGGVIWPDADRLPKDRDGETIDFNPQVATNGDGAWIVVWQALPSTGQGLSDKEIAFSRSPEGVTWSDQDELNIAAAAADKGNDTQPGITTNGLGQWMVVWQSDDARDGTNPADSDILFARFADCNLNDIDDVCETNSIGGSNDCDGNSVPDECQANCDGVGLPDTCELAECSGDPSCQDCNVNGIPDGCDIASGLSLDCNGNNGNGIPDECEVDTDGDAVVDSCDNCPAILNPDQRDCNDDGEGDACELAEAEQDNDQFGGPDGVCTGVDNCPRHNNPGQEDADLDGVGDACDNCPNTLNPGQENCDNDLFGDVCDSPGDQNIDGDAFCDDSDNCPFVPNDGQEDPDLDGVGDACDNCPALANPGQGDCDHDCPDPLNGARCGDLCSIVPNGGTSPDCNGNDMPDECEIDEMTSPDVGGPFFCDKNAPPVGLDACDPDCNDDGIPDQCDIDSGFSADCGGAPFGNHIPDECEFDCDGIGEVDSCTIKRCMNDPACSDCNKNDTPDSCDIADGSSQDSDGLGVPDECEFGPPRAAPYPHDRRKNRYISFDPNKTANDDRTVAFKITLTGLTLGSCSINGGFCREDRGSEDCNECSADGNACINLLIDCAPIPPQLCSPTGQACVNDAPDTGGTNVGQFWWVGPESPRGNGVHLMVSEAFRKISTDWPDPTHVGDCEIVPIGTYSIRAVEVGTGKESVDEPIETMLFATASSSWLGDCVGPLKKFCGGDIRTPGCTDDGDCTAPETCDRAWTLPDGSTNFDDVNAALALVVAGPTSVAPDTTWVDLRGNDSGTPGGQKLDPPNFVVNFSDIGQIIFGFQGRPYTFFDPADCPDEPCWPGCNNGQVVAPEECDGGIGCTCCSCDPGYVKADPLDLDCVPLGACCNGGNCTEETEAACTTGGGVYQGDGTTCASTACL